MSYLRQHIFLSVPLIVFIYFNLLYINIFGLKIASLRDKLWNIIILLVLFLDKIFSNNKNMKLNPARPSRLRIL